SLALALRRQVSGIPIYGKDSPEILDRARGLNAIDPGTAPSSADLMILATPVSAILKLLDELPSSSGLILDIGSTKAAICRKAEQRKLPFLGGHPMTGSERSGPDAATPDLFKGEPFFLCPVSTTPSDAVSKLKPLLEAIGSHPIVVDPEEHDRFVAQLSHLP